MVYVVQFTFHIHNTTNFMTMDDDEMTTMTNDYSSYIILVKDTKSKEKEFQILLYAYCHCYHHHHT